MIVLRMMMKGAAKTSTGTEASDWTPTPWLSWLKLGSRLVASW